MFMLIQKHHFVEQFTLFVEKLIIKGNEGVEYVSRLIITQRNSYLPHSYE